MDTTDNTNVGLGCIELSSGSLRVFNKARGTCNEWNKCLCTHVITTCDNTIGTSPVSDVCKCGNTECEAGEYCNAETNLCSTKKQPVHVYKFPITSDTCSDHGYVQINDTTTCDRAAESLGLSDTTSIVSAYTGTAVGLGCILDSYGALKVFNKARGTCNENHKCLCAHVITGVTCDNTDGTNPVSETCKCGTAECGAGDYCSADENLCQKVDECGVPGGSGIQEGKCDCDGNVLDACGVCDGGGFTCCAGNTCDSAGTATCSDRVDSRRCICNVGYTGANCEISKTNLDSEDSVTRANARSVLKAGLKASLPSTAKAVKKDFYAQGQRKIALKAAKEARREHIKIEREKGISWKDLVVEDTDEFEGYSDAVLAKRKAKLEAKRAQNPSAEYKIRYRAAPAGLDCLFDPPDLTLTKEEGMDLVDPEGCVTIGVEGEPGVIRMTKNGELFDLECNDNSTQTELDIGSNFTCQGRVWDIGSASTDTNDVSGCMTPSACNYNENANADGSCVYATGCDICSGEQDGTGTVVDKDADDDGVCDVADAFPNDPNESADSDNDGLGDNADTLSGCRTATACNYNPSATVNHDDALCDIANSTLCQTCVDGASQVTFDADSDSVCDDVDPCIGGNCVEDKVAVKYDGQIYEACQGATVEVLKIDGVAGNHNIWEGSKAVIEPLSTSPVTTTLLGALPGETREFYCSAHTASKFYITCPPAPEENQDSEEDVPAAPSTCPSNTTGMTAAEYINAQCCQCL